MTPSSYSSRLMSRLRAGPASVFFWQHAWLGSMLQVQPGAPIAGANGRGDGVKSAPPRGIGLVLSGLVFCVNPVKPVSSPVIVLFWANDPSGSVSGPKVLGFPKSGSMGFWY